MIVTSLFLLSLMCNYIPCDKKYDDPNIKEVSSETPSQYRFTRSGLSNPYPVQKQRNKALDEMALFSPDAPIVKTHSGLVEGYILRIINGRQIYAFEGIKYAEAPVGHLRFRDPVPVKPWSGIRQAKNPGPICLQYHVRKLVRITGSEDCLTLNVYTVGLPSELKGKLYQSGYPVIVWIHGGGYFHTSGSEFGPSYLLQENLLLVTLNFRQGALGFLSTADEESPGNQGLKDQALAIRWISENIANFGGDPTKITLMGSSTGSSAVHLHMMSPLSKHLFHGAISSSGTAFNHWAVNTAARSLRLTRLLAEHIGCPTTAGSRALMDCFRATNPYFLLHEQQRLYDFMTFPPILFAPIVESPGPQSFLPDTPENLYLTNQVSEIPWICTQTTEEGESFALAFKHVGRIPFYQKSFDKYAPFILDYWYIAKNASEITSKIREAYFGKDGPNPTEEAIQTVSDLVSDRYFRVGIHRAISFHSKVAPTYASLFGFRSHMSFSPQWEGSLQRYGVGHASDTGFYLNSSYNFPPLSVGTPNYDVSRMLINLVHNFANKREPFLTYKNGNTAKIWKPATSHGKDLQFLLIDNENVIMIPEPRQGAIQFWESLGLADTPPTILPKQPPAEVLYHQSTMTPEFLTDPPPPARTTLGSTNYYRITYTNNDANQNYSVYMNSLKGL